MTAPTRNLPTTAISARQDRWTGAIATGVTLIVAGSAGVLSFSALRLLAISSGIDPSIAWLYPAAVDGSIIAGSVVTVAAAIRSGARDWYGIFVVVVGSALSIFGNLSGAGANPSATDVVVHTAPSVLLILSLEGALSVTRKRLSLVATQAAEEAEIARKEEARIERARASVEAREAKAEAARAAAEEAKARAAAKAAAVSTANAVLGRAKDGARAQEIAAYASTVEGWAELSIPKRCALIHSQFAGVATGDILASETCVLVEGEDPKKSAKRVYKAVSELRLGAAENAATSPRRLAAV